MLVYGCQFFLPLTCVNIAIQYNKDGCPSGDADVDFASHEEAQEAMRRNKALMRELSLNTMLQPLLITINVQQQPKFF